MTMEVIKRQRSVTFTRGKHTFTAYEDTEGSEKSRWLVLEEDGETTLACEWPYKGKQALLKWGAEIARDYFGLPVKGLKEEI